jgi:hypothetical protein
LALEVKVEELTQLVRDRDQALDQQQAEVTKQRELLHYDRDIRELMGARDLCSAEVHDVAGNGEIKKTYGRVFCDKGKIAHLLRVRSGSGSGFEECQYVSSVGTPPMVALFILLRGPRAS